MLRSFRPTLETLETREVFAAGPLAGAGLAGLAASRISGQENVPAMVANARTETVNNDESIAVHVNRAENLSAAPVLRAVHDAAAHDALFTDLGNAGNDPAQIIAILIGMAKSPTSPPVADSAGTNHDAQPDAKSRAKDSHLRTQSTAKDSASNQSSLLASPEYYNLHLAASQPKAFLSSLPPSQIIAILIGL